MEILGLMRHKISRAVVQILSSFVRQKTVGEKADDAVIVWNVK